eukprot:scaffold295866_cov37-Prasinocladus_malaysianus.AAC.1
MSLSAVSQHVNFKINSDSLCISLCFIFGLSRRRRLVAIPSRPLLTTVSAWTMHADVYCATIPENTVDSVDSI